MSDTFGLYSQLCFPKAAGTINTTTLQFLAHGGHFGREYWNVAPGYSYVDYAAQQGYTTFFYDRLGVGLSDHPDPLNVVQTALHAEIANELVKLLRSGAVAGQAFENVVGIGHSYGSVALAILTADHPEQLDAVILTGASPKPSGIDLDDASTNAAIANQLFPDRFGSLQNGYYISSSKENIQFVFLRAPNFDPKMLDLAEATKQTQSIAELLAFGEPPISKDFTGPVYVMNGLHDLPACSANCLVPQNQAAAVVDVVYPKASKGSGWYLVPGTGHGINYHYSAPDAYAHMHEFIKSNGL
jgi:pimeloyl-ACP methyl ester carboxylesterase